MFWLHPPKAGWAQLQRKEGRHHKSGLLLITLFPQDTFGVVSLRQMHKWVYKHTCAAEKGTETEGEMDKGYYKS